MKPWGCHNRPPLLDHAMVQDGWIDEVRNGLLTRMPRMVMIAVPMSKDCQYTLSAPNDPRCEGCRWRARMESHA